MKFSNFDMRMFKVAEQVAETSKFKNFHIGCVITYKKHIVSSGVNGYKTHPVQKKYNKKYRNFGKSSKPIMDAIHAEVDALSNVSYPIEQNIDWKKVNIYIVRVSPGRELGVGMARPCAACINALRDKGIKNIYYSTNDGYAFEKIG